MIKIHGEKTRPTDAPTLCETCVHATVVRGTRFGDDFIMCGGIEPSMLIRFTVASCSVYRDKATPSIYAYHETAWQWMPDIDRFVSPNEKFRIAAMQAPPADPAPATLWRRVWQRLRRKPQ